MSKIESPDTLEDLRETLVYLENTIRSKARRGLNSEEIREKHLPRVGTLIEDIDRQNKTSKKAATVRAANRTVHKYPLEITRPCSYELAGNPVLVAEQNGTLCLWAEFGTEEPRMRTFEVFGTGHIVPVGARHVGSVVSNPFVWHVYETTAA